MKKTGSGPECAIKLSILEERALGVWGKVVVTGNSHITSYDGIDNSNNNNTISMIDIDEYEEISNIEVTTNTVDINEVILPDNNIEKVNNIDTFVSKEYGESSKPPQCTNKKTTSARHKPLSTLATHLLEVRHWPHSY
ncbi:hypothetical protein QE152_g37039 [Popillia japonica]|uniref:Uncharacterized protein n=1 Tax=Popillia japonica TaxID=7064 RepID=A0AAW1IBQ5_POPJA